MLLDHDPANMRISYTEGALSKSDLHADPFQQFEVWWQAAIDADHIEPNAMTLATATADGVPSARMVLLKGVDERGFVFYSNYESRKGVELAVNPRAALVLFWDRLQRQVRIEGDVERLTADESAEYFRSRPRDSQLGAWTSPQSTVIFGRTQFEVRQQELEAQFAGGPVPLPPFWGGYRVMPNAIEFWQGRPSRLHDRFRYTRSQDTWRIDRLAP